MERLLSFIPPDGNFRLLSYHIGSQSVVAIPMYVLHNINFREPGGGRLDITVGPKQTVGRTVSYCTSENFDTCCFAINPEILLIIES